MCREDTLRQPSLVAHPTRTSSGALEFDTLSLLQFGAFFPWLNSPPSRRSDPSCEPEQRRAHLCKLSFALVPPFSGSPLPALHVVTARRPRKLPPHSVIAFSSLPLRTAVAQIPTAISLAPPARLRGRCRLRCCSSHQTGLGSARPQTAWTFCDLEHLSGTPCISPIHLPSCGMLRRA
jgi:hypothetical protein